MDFPTNKLRNPYYFIRDNVVYEISDKQDADGCGKHYVTYVTKPTELKKGAKYLDVNGTMQVAEADGTYNVSNGNVDLTETPKMSPNFLTFPWACITYVEEEGGKPKKEYLWLDYLIEDGDKVEVVNRVEKFVINDKHSEGANSYVGLYKQQLINEFKARVKNGYAIAEIKKRMPEYVIANANDTILVNGKKVIFQSITDSDNVGLHFTDEDMEDYVYEAYKEQIIAYANRLLADKDANVCVTLPCNGEGHSNGDNGKVNDIESALVVIAQNNNALVGGVGTAQNMLADGINNSDPLNDDVLSESNLMNYSPTIRTNVETYGTLVRGENKEELMSTFKQDLVDTMITKNNPIYNYKHYSDENKSNLVSVGTFVINDYEYVTVDEEEKVYYQIKILADTASVSGLDNNNVSDSIDEVVWGNTHIVPKQSDRPVNGIVNNKYYAEISDVESIANGTTLSLLVKNNNEFVSANMFIEVFENNKLQGQDISGTSYGKKKGKIVKEAPKPISIETTNPPISERDLYLEETEDVPYVVSVTTIVFSNGCILVTQTWSNGDVTAYTTC